MNNDSAIKEIEKWCVEKVNWKPTEKSPYVFQHQFNGKNVFLRINDFPDEPICSVILGEDEFDMEHFPDNWKLPEKK